MDLDFAMLADGVAPRPDGKLDIYGAGWDTIFAARVPAQHARLVLALRILLSRHEAEHDHRIDVVIQAPDGDDLARANGSFPPLSEEVRDNLAPGQRFGIGTVLNFENVIFPDFGNYQIVIQWDGNEARPPLRLTVAEPPSQ